MVLPLRSMRALLLALLLGAAPLALTQTTTDENGLIFTIQTDTVLEPTPPTFSNSTTSSTSSSSSTSTSSTTSTTSTSSTTSTTSTTTPPASSSSTPQPPPSSTPASSTSTTPSEPTTTPTTRTTPTTSRTTTSHSTPTSDSGGDDNNGGSGAGGGVVTSIALSTYTIPLPDGGVTTSTAFAAPAETAATTTRTPVLQDGGVGVDRGLRDAGLLGAIVVGVWNLV